MKTKLSARQKRVINKISKRIAHAQAALLRTEHTCLTKFAEVVGYDSRIDAPRYVVKLLDLNQFGCHESLTDKADWSKALSRIALMELRARSNAKIAAELERLSPG